MNMRADIKLVGSEVTRDLDAEMRIEASKTPEQRQQQQTVRYEAKRGYVPSYDF